MKAVVLALSTITFLSLVALFAVWHELTAFLETPADPSAGEQLVVVPEGITAKDVAGLLEKEKLVAPGPWLPIYTEHLHPPAPMKKGEYKLSRSMSPVQQIERIESGRVVLYTIVIPGGASAADAVAALVEQGLGKKEELLELLESPSYLAELKLEGESLEGYLIADAYTAERGLPGKELLRQLLSRYRELVTPAALEEPKRRGLSEREVLVMASLVEKAPVLPDERRYYAALVYNRLAAGVPLESEAADAYGAAHAIPPTRPSKKSVPNRWNTSERAGLPATPICSPSAAALLAALQPAQGKALYMVERDNGSHVFCEDLECYVSELQRWNRPVPTRLPRPPQKPER